MLPPESVDLLGAPAAHHPSGQARDGVVFVVLDGVHLRSREIADIRIKRIETELKGCNLAALSFDVVEGEELNRIRSFLFVICESCAIRLIIAAREGDKRDLQIARRAFVQNNR